MLGSWGKLRRGGAGAWAVCLLTSPITVKTRGIGEQRAQSRNVVDMDGQKKKRPDEARRDTAMHCYLATGARLPPSQSFILVPLDKSIGCIAAVVQCIFDLQIRIETRLYRLLCTNCEPGVEPRIQLMYRAESVGASESSGQDLQPIARTVIHDDTTDLFRDISSLRTNMDVSGQVPLNLWV